MSAITVEQLRAYLDDALADGELAKIEQALRSSVELRQRLREVIAERDRGEHSLGAIWRRERLSCPSREQLGSFLLQSLEPELLDYIDFHLKRIECRFCLANLADLKRLQQEPAAQSQQRRRRIYQSSAGLISARRKR
jgi:hypothetical protein